MKNIFLTRLLHWKKAWPSITFWVALPIIATLYIVHITHTIQEDSKIPVGIVLDERTASAVELYTSLESSPLVRVYDLTENQALHQLEIHKLDSVFVVHEGYEEQIRKGKRNRLLSSYRSDLSFAFAPVKEMVISYVQQETGRSKAAYVISNLAEKYNADGQWTWDEIISKSKEVQKKENLLNSTFAFENTTYQTENNDNGIWDPWALWAVLSLLSTLLMLDWVIKERSSSIQPRFAFMRVSLPRYFIANLLVYVILFAVIDMLTIAIFNTFLNENVTTAFFVAIVTYRLMLTFGAFLIALCFRNTFIYYCFSFALTCLITIISGAILPNEGITSRIEGIQVLNPLQSFLSGQATYAGLILSVALTILWYVRKETTNA